MGQRVYIGGLGIISPLGEGVVATEAALRANRSAIGPLTLFPLLQSEPLPVGEVPGLTAQADPPRTHRLLHNAALQALRSCNQPPDAVILGNTTGGILTSEELLRKQVDDKESYRYHGLHSVADYLARQIGCRGPAITVSTACSSGAVAIALALKMLRSGRAKTVLAGGVDSLSRLTYFGFNSLQLVDKKGCRPLDTDRQGMAVAEGAALLLLSTERPEQVSDHRVHGVSGHRVPQVGASGTAMRTSVRESARSPQDAVPCDRLPEQPLAELLGAGLSCDAYHPAAPHPDGRGALKAMQAALADAGLAPSEIDYISLHGTGTLENDLAEAKAVKTLFAAPPALSSIKGATGHSLAAASAIEAVVSVIALTQELLPANTGCRRPDPALALIPLLEPTIRPTKAVLSNSFGFGGNNGCLVITKPESFSAPPPPRSAPTGLAIHGYAALTGAGGTAATISQLAEGSAVAGRSSLDSISAALPPAMVRRLKRLPRMALALALNAHQDSELAARPASVFMGTGWGALSETHDFLTRLSDSREQFPSPTDFVGSVHNGPAGQVAILFGATGANITTSGGDYSFEQALLSAEIMLEERENALLLGVDEGHQALSPLFDLSIAPGSLLADGGGAFCLNREAAGARALARIPFYQSSCSAGVIEALIAALGGVEALNESCALLLAGIPAAERQKGEEQLARFMAQSGLQAPVIRYREFTGEFASASAVAAVMAVDFLATGRVPEKMLPAGVVPMPTGNKKAILVLGLGGCLTAMEFSRPW